MPSPPPNTTPRRTTISTLAASSSSRTSSISTPAMSRRASFALPSVSVKRAPTTAAFINGCTPSKTAGRLKSAIPCTLHRSAGHAQDGVRAAGTPCCAARRPPTTRWPASWARWGCSESARAPVVHGDRAAAEPLRRDQLEPSRAGQPALVKGRAVAGDPGVDEELVLVDQIQPVQLGRELAATEEHAGRGRVLELLHARAQVAGDVVAVGPREVLSRRRHHVLRLGLQLDRPLAHRVRRLLVAASDRPPVALHNLAGDAAPQHGPALVHEAREKSVCLLGGGSLLVVDAAVPGDGDSEG